MSDIVSIVEALSSILWPIIVIIFIIYFRSPIEQIIESAKSRKWTIKIGGQELTMEEVNSQQRDLITDLQEQIIGIRPKIEGIDNKTNIGILEKINKESQSVLWVDDDPKKYTFIKQYLLDLGVNVDLALSTTEALNKYNQNKYNVILSDLGREENGIYNDHAGIDLLKLIRNLNDKIPFIIYCSYHKVEEYSEEARLNRATWITASATDLLRFFMKNPNQPKGQGRKN